MQHLVTPDHRYLLSQGGVAGFKALEGTKLKDWALAPTLTMIAELTAMSMYSCLDSHAICF